MRLFWMTVTLSILCLLYISPPSPITESTEEAGCFRMQLYVSEKSL